MKQMFCPAGGNKMIPNRISIRSINVRFLIRAIFLHLEVNSVGDDLVYGQVAGTSAAG